jgi:hypothetical protein
LYISMDYFLFRREMRIAAVAPPKDARIGAGCAVLLFEFPGEYN